MLISFPIINWMEDLKVAYDSDAQFKELLQCCSEGKLRSMYTLREGFLLYKNRLYIPYHEEFKNKLLELTHSGPWGHTRGMTKLSIGRAFYWPRLKADLKNFIRACNTCQRTKVDNTLPSGLLQPQHIPTQPWTHISMDFIDGLPISHEFDSLCVVMDRLMKYINFIPLKHPYTTKVVADLFLKHIFKMHGLPLSIVSNRDNTFTNQFCGNYSLSRGYKWP